MWPYSWTHVGTPSHLGHMDRVAATMPSEAHAGAAQEAPNIGQWEGQDVPLVRPSSCTVKRGIPSSRRYLPTYLGVLCCVCGVLGHLAPVLRCAHCVCCRESWATWLLFTGAPAPCVALRVWCPGPLGFLFTGVPPPWVVLRVPCPRPLGSCSPVCPLGVLCCACGVLGHLAPVHRVARSVCCVVCVVFWATLLLFSCAPARFVASRVRRPGPLGSCSPVCPLLVLFCVCRVLGLVAPVHRCARSVFCVACAVSWATWLLFSGAPAGCVVVCAESWATWLLFTGAPAPCVALRVWCPGPLGFLFTGVPAPWVVLRVPCPGPLGSCSPVCPLGVLCCACGVLGHLAPVHRCARSVRCVVCVVFWAS